MQNEGAHHGANVVDDDDFEAQRRAFMYPTQLDDHLCVGSYRHAGCSPVLAELNITAILCVKDSCRFPGDETVFAHVPLSDFGDTELCGSPVAGAVPNDSSAVPDDSPLGQCAAFVRRCAAEGRVTLVHCSQGVNRAPTVAIGVLMLNNRWTLRRAYQHVAERRGMASPHERYFEQLQDLDVRLHGGDGPSLTREDVGPSLQQIMRDAAAKADAETGTD